jgi:hypothetical protein
VPHEHRGAAVLDLEEAVNRLFEKLKKDGPLRACPQGDDCAGESPRHARILDCEEGCGFQGCAACMALHEEEPHVSDADATREMFSDRGIRNIG